MQGKEVVLGTLSFSDPCTCLLNVFTLGAKEKVVYIEDIDNSTTPRHINTKSDVFTVLQKAVRALRLLHTDSLQHGNL